MIKWKRIIIISGAAILAALVVVFFLFRSTKVSLDEEYYEGPGIVEISSAELEQLVDAKKSFILFLSQPGCRTAEDLRSILQDFSIANNLQILETTFSDFRTNFSEVRYYPSVVIFEDGKIRAFLDANSDSDTDAYLSSAGFEAWFSEHVRSRS